VTGLAADPLCLKHDPGFGHPECPERYEAVITGLDEAGLIETLKRIPGRDATRGELRRAHASHYLDIAEHQISWPRAILSCARIRGTSRSEPPGWPSAPWTR